MPNARPLSPHLQIYRWQLTMVLSILHRATGIALAIGTLLLVWWLLATASGDTGAYDAVQGFIGSWLGRLLLLGWTYAFFHHLAGGIRHFVWDAGYGFDIPTTYASGWSVVGAAVVLTLVSWIAGYWAMGAF